MPVYPPAHTHATLASSARPRVHYCWLHGYNSSHEENVCKVMTNDPQYTSAMRNATSEIGSGGNPKIGVPVTFTRPTFFSPFHRSLSCSHCPPSHHFPPPLAGLPEIVGPIHPVMTLETSSDLSSHPSLETSSELPSPTSLHLSEGFHASRVRDLASSLSPAVTDPFRVQSTEPFPSDPTHTTL